MTGGYYLLLDFLFLFVCLKASLPPGLNSRQYVTLSGIYIVYSFVGFMLLWLCLEARFASFYCVSVGVCHIILHIHIFLLLHRENDECLSSAISYVSALRS